MCSIRLPTIGCFLCWRQAGGLPSSSPGTGARSWPSVREAAFLSPRVPAPSACPRKGLPPSSRRTARSLFLSKRWDGHREHARSRMQMQRHAPAPHRGASRREDAWAGSVDRQVSKRWTSHSMRTLDSSSLAGRWEGGLRGMGSRTYAGQRVAAGNPAVVPLATRRPARRVGDMRFVGRELLSFCASAFLVVNTVGLRQAGVFRWREAVCRAVRPVARDHHPHLGGNPWMSPVQL